MKSRKSKLDPYGDRLDELEAQGKTLAEMVAELAAAGCAVSAGRLSGFLSARRSARQQAMLLAQITNGARQVKDVESAFAKNPAPAIETLIKLHRVMILQLSTQAADNPDLLKLTDQLTRTVMEFIAGETKAKLESGKLALAERRVQLLEQKAAAYDQMKAAVSSGGLTPETLTKIERELKLL